MNVIYFFIILCIVNITMFLLITQCLKYYKNKSSEFQGIIMVTAIILFTLISALIYAGMIGWNNKENFYPYWNLGNGFQVSPPPVNNVWLSKSVWHQIRVIVSHINNKD